MLFPRRARARACVCARANYSSTTFARHIAIGYMFIDMYIYMYNNISRVRTTKASFYRILDRCWPRSFLIDGINPPALRGKYIDASSSRVCVCCVFGNYP